MDYTIKIPIGDWSKDGHSQCEIITISSNYSAKVLQDSYKESCRVNGVQFNHNQNYTCIEGLDYDQQKKIQVCTEYEDNSIPDKLLELMKQHNAPQLNLYETSRHFDGIVGFVETLLWFIGLSAPKEWEYTIEVDEGEYLNGFWSNELNVQFGYGLFC